MSKLSQSLLMGFEKYYNTITHVGQIHNNVVNKFLIATFINDILEGRYDFLVTEEQYEMLNELYMCLEGSCLVPYQKYCSDITVNKHPVVSYIRMLEENVPVIEKDRILEGTENNIRTF